MLVPSSNTSPAIGFSKRHSALSRVDLPQALGPMITLNLPAGIATLRSRAMILLS